MLIWPLFVVGYNAQSMLSLSHTHFVYEIKFNMRNSKEQKYNETLSIISAVQCFLGCTTFTDQHIIKTLCLTDRFSSFSFSFQSYHPKHQN